MKRLALVLVVLLLVCTSWAGDQRVAGNIIPESTGYSLGTSLDRWNGKFQNVDISGTLTCRGTPCLFGVGAELPSTVCTGTDKFTAYDAVTHTFTCSADVAGSGGGGGTWGSITGTLSDQTDLASALAGKQASGSYLNTSSFTRTGVVALWTSCVAGYLKYDGTCDTPATGGSPTFSGLTTGCLMYASSSSTIECDPYTSYGSLPNTTRFISGISLETVVANTRTDLLPPATLANNQTLYLPDVSGGTSGGSGTLASTAYVTTAIAVKAPLASPALTGTPTAPTASVGTNTTQVATTAFVLANTGGARPFSAGFNNAGIPSTGTYLYDEIIGTYNGTTATVTIPSNCSGSTFGARVAATASSALLVAKNGSTICTFTVALGGTTATITGTGSSTTLTNGDRITIVGGGDATLSGIAMAVNGSWQ